MVFVKLWGGLGNQMFQYAAARRLASHLGTKLGLDIAWFDSLSSISTHRDYELRIFQLGKNEGLVKNPQVLSSFKPYAIIQRRLLQPKIYEEVDGRFNPGALELNNNVYLDGYFQSPHYFDDSQTEIRGCFKFQGDTSSTNKQIISTTHSQQSVALHVRRGDYVSNKQTNAVHGTTSLEYYLKAVKYIKDRIDSPTFYIFSDDPEWTKQNIKLEDKAVYVNHNIGSQSYEDMRLMSCCKHNIIANSSFSWWGAWLNENPDKIVVTPRDWFADKSRNTNDLRPASWLKI